MDGHPTKAPHVLDVIWRLLPLGWLKVNTDRASFGGLGLAGCVGVFHTYRDFINGCFAILLGVCFAFEDELVVVVHAIEYD